MKSSRFFSYSFFWICINHSLMAYQAPPVDARPFIPAEHPYDRFITQELQRKMREDYYLAPYVDQIYISTTNGVITLTGTIDSSAIRLKIEQKARNISRVRQVINNIYLNPTPPYIPPI